MSENVPTALRGDGATLSTTADHCIVGAGPAGLAAARAFLALGLTIDVFERHSAAGGIWDQGNPGSPMYDSAHFISSRQLSGYLGFPMPETYPDYPAIARSWPTCASSPKRTGSPSTSTSVSGWTTPCRPGTAGGRCS